MARPARPQFSSLVAPYALGYLRSRGLDADALARKYLPQLQPHEGAFVPISTATFRKLMADAAQAASDPLFGMHLGIAMPRGAYGLLEFAARSAPTARVALEQLARYGALINPAARFWLEPGEGELALHHRLPNEPGGIGRHGNLFTVARLLVLSRELMGEDLKPGRVWFAHAERACPPELAAFLGTDRVAFGQSSNGLSFADKFLDRKLPGADPELNAVLREHANRLLAELAPESTGERTRKAVAALLPQGEVQLAKVARKLALSERTLQRRLTEDGISFAELVAEVRAGLAASYLAQADLPVAEIAAKLGYADAAAFGRAFKRWTGKSPGAYRAS